MVIQYKFLEIKQTSGVDLNVMDNKVRFLHTDWTIAMRTSHVNYVFGLFGDYYTPLFQRITDYQNQLLETELQFRDVEVKFNRHIIDFNEE